MNAVVSMFDVKLDFSYVFVGQRIGCAKMFFNRDVDQKVRINSCAVETVTIHFRYAFDGLMWVRKIV